MEKPVKWGERERREMEGKGVEEEKESIQGWMQKETSEKGKAGKDSEGQ